MFDDEDWSWDQFWSWTIRLFMVAFVVGMIVLALTGVLGTWWNEVNNTLFNTSQQHTGAVAQKFSDDCLQLAQSKDQTTRRAIENDIYQLAGTVDLKSIQMPDATRQCVNRAIDDVTNGK